MSPVLSFLIASATLLAACSSSTSPNGGGGGGGGGLGTFSADIDGAPWATAAAGLTVTSNANNPGYIVIAGVSFSGTDYKSLQLALGYIGATGTYPIGVNPGTTPGGSGSVLIKTGANLYNYFTDFPGNAGSITITKLTSTEIAGTFSFVAPPALGSGAPGTKTITNGAFDVTLPAAYTPPSATDYGNTITATLNGQPWVGATVVGVGDLSTGSAAFGGTTTGISINLVTLMAVSAGNTYDQTGFEVSANGSGVNCCWGGPNVVASVTVTSMSATRIAGTFTATLPKVSGGAPGNLVITNGAFDTKVQ